jgi:HEAT repeat protein
MSFFLISALLLSSGLQSADEVRALVESLRSERIEVRSEAERKLKHSGMVGLSELKKATKSSDPEVASRAARLMKVIPIVEQLTPNLLRMHPGIEDELATKDDAAWTATFLQVAARDDRGKPKHKGVTPADIDALARHALRGAADTSEIKSVCNLIARWRVPSPVDELVGLLQSESDEVRAVAVNTLGQIQARKAVGDIRALLTDAHPDVRLGAVKSLEQLIAKDAIEDILKLLADASPQVRAHSLRAISALGARVEAKHFTKPLNDPLTSVRLEALSTIEALGVKAAAPELLKFMNDDEPRIRARTIAVLAELDEQPAIPQIARALSDKSTAVRMRACYALARLGAKSAVGELSSKLDDESPAVRSAAAFALGMLQERGGEEKLIQLLGDVEADVRASATQALGYLRSKSSASKVAERLEDPSPEVRLAAVASLVRIDASNYVSGLEALLNKEDLDPDFRRAIARALCSQGNRKGASILLSEAKRSVATSLWALNCIKEPDSWSRIAAFRAHSTTRCTRLEALESVSRGAEVKLDLSRLSDRAELEGRQTFVQYAGADSGVDIIETALIGTPFLAVLSAGTLLLLPRAEALTLLESLAERG